MQPQGPATGRLLMEREIAAAVVDSAVAALACMPVAVKTKGSCQASYFPVHGPKCAGGSRGFFSPSKMQ